MISSGRIILQKDNVDNTTKNMRGRLLMPKVKLRNKEENKPVLPINIDLLDIFIKYTLCDCVSKFQLSNLQKLLSSINETAYKYEPDIMDKLNVLMIMLDGILNSNISDTKVLEIFISQHDRDLLKMINGGDLKGYKNLLSASECDFVGQIVNERLNSLVIFKHKDTIIDYLDKISKTYVTSYKELIDGFKSVMTECLTELNSTSLDMGPIREFSFDDPSFTELIELIVEKSNLPAAVLQTGVRQMNYILSPGFHCGRLYVFLGGTGKFKSGTLLNMADQIRKFNPQIKPVENGRRKTILFVTMENTIEETIVRLFSMYSDVNDEIYGKTPEDVIEVLRGAGKYTFTDDYGIDITFRYFTDKEIDTGELYNIVNDCKNMNKEPLCIILDYIKRIESVRPNYGDERVRLSNAAKELKALAQILNIPVITAMQLNRDGNNIIDSAMDGESKQDVLRFVGASNIGNCWDIMEEADWVAVINLERKLSTNELFLSVKRLKIRYEHDKMVADYFNHPFSNVKGIRMLTDVDLEKSMSIASLANDLESLTKKETNDIINVRPKVSAISTMKDNTKASRTLQSIGLDGVL